MTSTELHKMNGGVGAQTRHLSLYCLAMPDAAALLSAVTKDLEEEEREVDDKLGISTKKHFQTAAGAA